MAFNNGTFLRWKNKYRLYKHTNEYFIFSNIKHKILVVLVDFIGFDTFYFSDTKNKLSDIL